MQLQHFNTFKELDQSGLADKVTRHLLGHPNGNFFQGTDFFKFIGATEGYSPVMIAATDDSGQIIGSLLGVIQSNGSGLKSFLSRRLIVWGGPLVTAGADMAAVTEKLLKELIKYADGRAIYVEFRNFFDTTDQKQAFESCGFEYRAHLNYLVKTDEEAAVKKRTSSSRIRQIKSSLKAGAQITEAADAGEVMAFYAILQKLYKEKVKKPLPAPDLFLNFFKAGIGKFFMIKLEGRVIGGIMCPVFDNKVIYEWYVCGEDGLAQGLHPSVLATWAPIEYGYQNGFDHFDFMGAGRPDEDYGVREFKARFGGDEVCFGRYEMVVNKSLYKVGKIGLKVYQSIK